MLKSIHRLFLKRLAIYIFLLPYFSNLSIDLLTTDKNYQNNQHSLLIYEFIQHYFSLENRGFHFEINFAILLFHSLYLDFL